MDRLAPLVFDELKRNARRLLRQERSSHTLQPTALVNEAFLNLIRADIDWQGRAHFFALSARMMRRVLINHAHASNAAKRGGDAVRVTLIDDLVPGRGPDAVLLDLERALAVLEAKDERKARLMEYQYFGGLTVRETAEVMGISESTVTRESRFARAWLKDQLSHAG